MMVLWGAWVAWNAAIAVWDARTGRIPNGWVLSGVVGFWGAQWLLGHGLAATASGVLVGGIGLVFWALGWIGGGDHKHSLGLGVQLGVWGSLWALVLAALLNGGIRGVRWAQGRARWRDPMRWGPGMALAAIGIGAWQGGWYTGPHALAGWVASGVGGLVGIGWAAWRPHYLQRGQSHAGNRHTCAALGTRGARD